MRNGEKKPKKRKLASMKKVNAAEARRKKHKTAIKPRSALGTIMAQGIDALSWAC